ncbi:MAG: tetratricopeptide repeat protein [Gammaproteobacteria bacterium]|nr:tetratricopeptide repeat protein [Gammaproteobacteria bacterium]MDH5652445.1 tetratricopeptide repeat protein [Gammaproteobacteria bacterium]
MRHSVTGIFLVLLSINSVTAAGTAEIETLLEKGRHAEALAELDKLTDSPQLRFLRARALAATGKTEEAIKLYQALIKQFPARPESYNNLAALYVQQGKPEQAQAVLEKGMQSHPAYHAIYRNLSSLYVERARDAYGKALQINAQKAPQLDTLARLDLPEPTPQRQNTPQNTPVAEVKTKPVAMIFQADRNKTDKKSDDRMPVIKPQTETGHEAAVKVLQSWAAAWAAKDADAYVSHYVNDYATYGLTHAVWVAQRRERLAAPKWIKVELRNFKPVSVTATQVRIRLEQKYASDEYQDLSRKEFVLIKESGAWKILREKSLGFVVR